LARGDYGVVSKHLAALQDYSPEYCKAYDALNRLAERILPRGEDVELREAASCGGHNGLRSSRASQTKKVVSIGGKG
jgi:hypothetical protein